MDQTEIDQLINEARSFALTHNESLYDSILYGGHDEEVKKLLERAMLDRLLPGIDEPFADAVADYVHAARAFHPGIVILTDGFSPEQKQQHEENVAVLQKDYEAAQRAYEERESLLSSTQRQIIQRLSRMPYSQTPYEPL